MDEKQFLQLVKRLDGIARLLALNLPEEIDQNRKIAVLSDSGLRPKEIAVILGTTPNAVRIVLHRMRRRNRRGEQNAQQEE